MYSVAIKSNQFIPLAFSALLHLTFGLVIGWLAPPAVAGKPAPIYGLDHPQRIPDQYLVVLKAQASTQDQTSLQQEMAAGGLGVERQFQHAFQGFRIRTPKNIGVAGASNLLDALAHNPQVAFIEADRWVYAQENTANLLTQSPSLFSPQSPVTWGLDRIDQEDLPLSNSYSYNHTGAGVNVYVIDSGIRADHQEFAGRVRGGASFGSNPSPLEDCTGHGTHVAGTIGGINYGVAKAVNLWSLRVFDCTNSASWSQIIAALEWVISNHQRPAVVNMSLGGSRFNSANLAVENAIAAGISVVVAAGNNSEDACNYSPASADKALAVGASTITDKRADFSN